MIYKVDIPPPWPIELERLPFKLVATNRFWNVVDWFGEGFYTIGYAFEWIGLQFRRLGAWTQNNDKPLPRIEEVARARELERQFAKMDEELPF